eukprot:g2480.t1
MDRQQTLSETTKSEFRKIISELVAVKGISRNDWQITTDNEGQGTEALQAFSSCQDSVHHDFSPYTKPAPNGRRVRKLRVESKYRKAKKLLGGQITRSSYLSELLNRERKKNKNLVHLLHRSMGQMNQQLALIKEKFNHAKIEIRRLSSVLYLTEKEKDQAFKESHSLQEELKKMKERENEGENIVAIHELSHEVSIMDVESGDDASWRIEALESGCKILEELVEIVYEYNKKPLTNNKAIQTKPVTCDQQVQCITEDLNDQETSMHRDFMSVGIQVDDNFTRKSEKSLEKDLFHYKALCANLEEIVERIDRELEQERKEVVSLCTANLELQHKLNKQIAYSPSRAPSVHDQRSSVMDKWELPSSVGSLDTKSLISQ